MSRGSLAAEVVLAEFAVFAFATVVLVAVGPKMHYHPKGDDQEASWRRVDVRFAWFMAALFVLVAAMTVIVL